MIAVSQLVLIVSASFILTSATAFAQAQSLYDGVWKAEYIAKSGTAREGKVVISGSGGNWDMAVQQRGNPCTGRAYPLSIVTASDTELSFKIERSTTLAGCQDGVALLKRVDAKTLEGEFDGLKLRMVRQ